MASIWFVQDGSPRKGKRVAEKTFEWCVDELALYRELWLPKESKAFIIEAVASDLEASGIPRRIFVELKTREAKGLPDKLWISGFYLVGMQASVVKRKLAAHVEHRANPAWQSRSVNLSMRP